MKLTIPDLTDEKVIDYCNFLDEIDLTKEDRLIYDYGHMKTFNPFGMLLMGSKIREVVRNYKDIEHIDKNYKPHTYAGTMGYFRSVMLDYGKEPGEASGNLNYIPLTEINLKQLENEKQSPAEHIGYVIERHSIRLANVFSRGNEELNELLAFMIREMMRNVIEHSNSPTLWFAGQVWPYKGEVEIALLDEGSGILKSLSRNVHYRSIIDNHTKALRYALQPGITKAFKRKMSDDVWANSGFGLYMTSELCNYLDGHFIIVSGDSSLKYSNNALSSRNTSFKGTAICMRIKTQRANEVKDIKNRLIIEGERKAKKMKKIALSTASTASKSLSMSKLFANENISSSVAIKG